MKNFPPNMAILIIVIFLVICAAVIFLSRQKGLFLQDNSNLQSPQISSTMEPVASEISQLSGSDSAVIDQTSPSSTTSASLPLADYIYPQATIISDSQSKLTLESTADPDQVTNWYKSKIRESGFNAKSFSQTNQNGVILNKLSGAKPGEKIEITIKKDQTGSKVAITVDRS